MSKFSGIQKILVILIVVISILGLILKFSGGNVLSNLGYDTLTLLKYTIVDYPIETLKNFTHSFLHAWL